MQSTLTNAPAMRPLALRWMGNGSRGDSFVPATWEEAFHRIREVFATVPGNQMTAIAGQLADAESMVALKELFHRLGSDNLLFENESAAPAYGIDVRYLIDARVRGSRRVASLTGRSSSLWKCSRARAAATTSSIRACRASRRPTTFC